MRNGQVPSGGPSLDGRGSSAFLEKYRQTTNAAPVTAVAAGAAVPIFAVPVSIMTRVAGETFRAILAVSRDNADPNGTGSYQITLDGVAVGTARVVEGDNAQGLVLLDVVRTIPAAGIHIIGAQCTAAVGDETIAAGSNLIVQANEF